jgi:hypothetical protein
MLSRKQNPLLKKKKMPEKDNIYSHSDIQVQLICFLNLLEQERLLENFSTQHVYRWVTTSGKRGPNCKFNVTIEEDRPLVFAPVKLGSKTITADICTSCARRGRNRLDLDEHTILVRLWDRPSKGESNVICRAHVDLATSGQSGPWSHLQFGGRSIKTSEKWGLPKEVSELRWPSPLFDIILACELIVYNFWPDKWSILCGRQEFISQIHKSEDSYIRPFFEACNRYWRLGGGERITFLKMLCNKSNNHPWCPT